MYRRESLTFLDEALPLLASHWREIAHYPDIPLDIHREAYEAMERNGTLRIFTVRTSDPARTLVGYAVFIVSQAPHYRASRQALQDVLYIHPEFRGGGLAFVNWCDDQLRAEGVQVSYQHVKASANFGPALERLGYELVDMIYARRLDKCAVFPLSAAGSVV